MALLSKPQSSFLGMKSHRRTAMMEMARTRGANQAALERSCIAELIEQSNRMGRTRNLNREEMPFDEGDGTNEIEPGRVEPFLRRRENSHEENSHSAWDDKQHKIATREEKDEKTSMGIETEGHEGGVQQGIILLRVSEKKNCQISDRRVVPQRPALGIDDEAEERLPFDETQQVQKKRLDTANFSPLVQFRTEQQRLWEQNLKDGGTGMCGSRNKNVATTVKSNHDVKRRRTRFPSKSNFKEATYRDTDDVCGRRIAEFSKQEYFHQDNNKTVPRKPTRFSNVELPFDETPSESDSEQTQSSLDGGPLPISRTSKYTKTSNPLGEISFKKRRMQNAALQCPFPTSLATEVARFKLLRSITIQAGEPEKRDQVSSQNDEFESSSIFSIPSELTGSKSTKESSKKFTYPQLIPPSRVAVNTSKRIMNSLHSESGQPSAQNIVIWTSSDDSIGKVSSSREALSQTMKVSESHEERNANLFNSQLMTLPANATVSSLEGSVSSIGRRPNYGLDLDREEHVRDKVTQASSAFHLSIYVDGSRSALKPYVIDDEAILPIPFAGKAKKDREEEQAGFSKTLWSFYDPQEVEALSQCISIEAKPSGKQAPSVDTQSDLSDRNDRRSSFNMANSQSESQEDLTTSTEGRTPLRYTGTEITRVSSDFSFSHLLGSKDMDDAEDDSLPIDVDKILEKVAAVGRPKVQPKPIFLNPKENSENMSTASNMVASRLDVSPKYGSRVKNKKSADEESETIAVIDSYCSRKQESTESSDSTSRPTENKIEKPIEKTFSQASTVKMEQRLKKRSSINIPKKSNCAQTDTPNTEIDSCGPVAPCGVMPAPRSMENPRNPETIYLERGGYNQTVPDFAIANVVGSMDKFISEHEKNKHIFDNRISSVYVGRKQKDDVAKRASKHIIEGRDDEFVSANAVEDSSKRDEPQNFEQVDAQEVPRENSVDQRDAPEEFMKCNDDERDSTIDSAFQRPRTSKVSEIAAKGRDKLDFVLLDSESTLNTFEDHDTRTSLDGSYLVQIASAHEMKQRQLMSYKAGLVARKRFLKESFKTNSAAFNRHTSILGSVSSETETALVEMTSWTNSTATGEGGAALGLFPQILLHASSVEHSVLTCPFEEDSWRGSRSIPEDWSTRYSPTDRLDQYSAGLHSALAARPRLDSCSGGGDSVSRDMLHILSKRHSRNPRKVREIEWDHGIFCECTGAPFDE